MDTITIYEATVKSTGILKAAGVGPAAAEARSILCGLLQCSKAYLFAHDREALPAEAETAFFEKIRLRAGGMPLQHLTGVQEFMSLDFEVNGHVLIPRQDTEVLVEAVLDRLSAMEQPVEILDLCTGSGCIAVSLAYYCRTSRLTAVDLSPAALEVAARNSARHGVDGRVRLVCGSLFDGIQGKFHVIVSNPPYIPTAEIERLSVEVRDFEPGLALDGGADGLDFYRAIAGKAPAFLAQGGLLALETGFDQAGAVGAMMSPHFSEIVTRKDLSGIDRVVLGTCRQLC